MDTGLQSEAQTTELDPEDLAWTMRRGNWLKQAVKKEKV